MPTPGPIDPEIIFERHSKSVEETPGKALNAYGKPDPLLLGGSALNCSFTVLDCGKIIQAAFGKLDAQWPGDHINLVFEGGQLSSDFADDDDLAAIAAVAEAAGYLPYPGGGYAVTAGWTILERKQDQWTIQRGSGFCLFAYAGGVYGGTGGFVFVSRPKPDPITIKGIVFYFGGQTYPSSEPIDYFEYPSSGGGNIGMNSPCAGQLSLHQYHDDGTLNQAINGFAYTSLSNAVPILAVTTAIYGGAPFEYVGITGPPVGQDVFTFFMESNGVGDGSGIPPHDGGEGDPNYVNSGVPGGRTWLGTGNQHLGLSLAIAFWIGAKSSDVPQYSEVVFPFYDPNDFPPDVNANLGAFSPHDMGLFVIK